MDWIRNHRQKISETGVDAYGMDKKMLCRFCETRLENESAIERLFERKRVLREWRANKSSIVE